MFLIFLIPPENNFMKQLFLVILLSLSFNSHADRRIIGGTNPTESYPWMLRLFDDTTGMSCGASLIDPFWALTAAHCLDEPFNQLTIAVNQTQINDNTNVEKIPVSRVIRHYLWDTDNINTYNDLALLQLATPVKEKPILIADNNTNATLSRVLGFGVTNLAYRNQTSDLKQLDLPIVSKEICQAAYRGLYNLIDSQICAGFAEGQKDSCSGDSGGPLIVWDNNQWKQLGLVSFGGTTQKPCAAPTYYGIYTKLSAFKPFISEIINSNIQLQGEVSSDKKSVKLKLLEHFDLQRPRDKIDVWLGLLWNDQFYFITGTSQSPQLSLQPQPFKLAVSSQETEQILLDLVFSEKISGQFHFYAVYTLNEVGLDLNNLRSNIAQWLVYF
ncbi:MAG: hypothetical protein RIT27_197 [Pseudomonadota bacterium]|jgi:secreted trypsin-like serine protease